MAKKTSLSSKPKRSYTHSNELEKHVLLTKEINDEGELTNAFDPMQDMHLWTMWRSAVTGKIIDETKSFEESDFRQHPYGKSLVQTPLKRLIKLEATSMEVAKGFMNPFRGAGASTAHRRSNPPSSQGSTVRNGSLGTGQFVFYGVPRAMLKKK